MGHRVGFKGDLTILENLRFECGLRSAGLEGIDEVLERLALIQLTGLPIRSLSAGQQRRVALARTLTSGARLWLMDEPFANLDASGKGLVIELVSEHLARDGVCVMAAHQDVRIDRPVQRIQLQ
ncbi:MAG: ATP-binding cassette domain-containing protein [Woeseia sp.]